MDAWLSNARDAIAREAGLDPARLELSDNETLALLDLARIAAHESGERTNAPLLCYLAGRAGVSGTKLAQLVDAIGESNS
jgi:hypothetical protein